MTRDDVARTGGCLCGAVRYVVRAEPLAVRTCWCRTCQYIACGGATVNAFFASDAVEIAGVLADLPGTADSGAAMLRRFCPACGTHVTTAALSRPHLLGLRVGTLDDPGAYPPEVAIWTARAPSWACIDPTLPQMDGQPPPAG